MTNLVQAFLHALAFAGAMTWQILWSLLLGFIISAVIQAVVRKQTVAKLLGNDHPKTLALASALGIASSSCSYASVAIARTLFQKGANFTAAMVFEIASTNLVVELGVVMAILLGWQFTLAEFIGGPLMIIMLAVIFRLFLRKKVIDAAMTQVEEGVAGAMEGHAAMDMSIGTEGPLWQRLRSPGALTSISHIFVMEIAAIWKDLVGGLLLAGAVAAWVPSNVFRTLFMANDHFLALIWGPIVGPLIAVVTFVCSIGNVPLAAVLWNDGISFGGVISFVFADLIIIPILLIYRKYYGTRMTVMIAVSFYTAMVIAGWLSEIIIGTFHAVPSAHHSEVISQSITFNYTTVLNVVFLLLGSWLLVRFVRSGALPMLKMMEGREPISTESNCQHDC